MTQALPCVPRSQRHSPGLSSSYGDPILPRPLRSGGGTEPPRWVPGPHTPAKPPWAWAPHPDSPLTGPPALPPEQSHGQVRPCCSYPPEVRAWGGSLGGASAPPVRSCPPPPALTTGMAGSWGGGKGPSPKEEPSYTPSQGGAGEGAAGSPGVTGEPRVHFRAWEPWPLWGQTCHPHLHHQWNQEGLGPRSLLLGPGISCSGLFLLQQ